MRFKEFVSSSFLTEDQLSEAHTYAEIQDLIKSEVSEPVKTISAQLVKIKSKAADLKAWAMENYKFAKVNGYNTAILDKMINHPEEVIIQIAKRMLSKEHPDVDSFLSKI